jgi:hypothetical protein
MAGKFKVDLSGVQEFFIDKGEKIALGLCVLAAGLLVTMGVLDAASVRTAPNSTKPYAQTMLEATATLKSRVDNPTPDEKRIEAPEANFQPLPWQWSYADVRYVFGKLFDMNDSGSSKRLNPRVMAPLAGTDTIDMKYIAGCYFAHDINAAKGKQTIVVYQPIVKADPAAPLPVLGMKKNKEEINAQPAIVTRPLRMVVVNCVFPMTEQLQEFQNAFRMQNQAELFASKDLPYVLGINVWKSEVIPGKDKVWKALIVAKTNAAGEVNIEVDDSIRKLFREALLDEDNLALYSPFMIQGLTMALPRLAILPAGQYPLHKLKGLELDENAPAQDGRGGPAMPGMPTNQFNPFAPQGGPGGRPNGMAGGGVGGKDIERVDDFPWKGLKKDLQDKLNDRTNVLDPRLVNFDAEDEKRDPDAPARQPNMLEGFFQGNSLFSSALFWTRYPKPAQPAGKDGKKNPAVVANPYDALLRFVDPTVESGKTYQYMVQVRMANPNFGKKEDVAFPALAEVKELPPSPLVETPTITIPGEYYLYAVDETPMVRVVHGSDSETPKEGFKQESVAVQIHRWVDEAKQTGARDQAIGDWCIAERLYIKRGDPVGREVNVEVPTWNSEENHFQLGKAIADNGGLKQPPPIKIKGPAMMMPPVLGAMTSSGGIPVNFAVTTPPPVLVDFDGGKRELRVIGANSARTTYQDQAASNLLILRADGTLIVRNTRTDSEIGTPLGVERLKRIDDWKTKTAPLRMAPGGNGKPGNPLFRGS